MAQQHINYSSPNDGLGDTLRTSQVKSESNFNELYTNKVDKVGAKVLTDVNFSAVDKAKLDLLDPLAGAQSNWIQGDNLQPDYIKNKPTKVSDFTNDTGFITDVGAAGQYVRSLGVWQLISLLPLTMLDFPRLIVAQQNFTLPTGAIARQAFVNGTIWHLLTANNAAETNTFTQTGAVVTFKTIRPIGNYIVLYYQ